MGNGPAASPSWIGIPGHTHRGTPPAGGLYGFTQIFPSIARAKRARVTIKIGKPIGPFSADGSGCPHRDRLDEIGHEIMRHIADLLPPELRGFYSNDPDIQEAARGIELFPWADKIKGEVAGRIH